MKRLASLPPLFTLLLALLSGCATVENQGDPLEGLNRGTYQLNDVIDKVAMKPAAKTYVIFTPSPMRKAVSNFYDNITYLNTVLNDFLQGKGKQGSADFGRFLVNTTVGIGGLFDVATSMGLEKHEEDLGQTLAVWGASQGAYIVYPFFGPNSVRKTPDFITATATDGLFWLSLAGIPQVTIPLAVLKYIDQRARLLDASGMRDELALDPYIFTREAWRQRREYLIYDGNPPAKQQPQDDWEQEDDDWSKDEFDQ